MRKLKAVAMGAGYFSRFQYEAWTRIPEVEMAAIYNRTEEKARAMMAQYGVARYYFDWREMIDRERPDFVAAGLRNRCPLRRYLPLFAERGKWPRCTRTCAA